MTKKRSSANDTGMPDASELHLNALYLHGLLTALNDFDPYDARSRNGAAAIAHAAEKLAGGIVDDTEKLMERHKR